MKWQSWLKVIIIIFIIIFITIGFLAGYFYGGACNENPLAYGVKQLNELNKDDFTCSCSSKSGKSFDFNEERINHNLNHTLEEFLLELD